MSRVTDWPTREEYETDRRRHAAHMIEHGVDDKDERSFTAEERAKAERLAPEAIKVVRRSCGRIERQLRREHPEVVWLLKPDTARYLSGEFDAALDALSTPARAAFLALSQLSDVRRTLRIADVLDWDAWSWNWPDGFDPPACPELDRLRAIRSEELTRRRAQTRDRGRRLLAAIESGQQWEDQLKHRAFCDAYFARGPVVRTV